MLSSLFAACVLLVSALVVCAAPLPPQPGNLLVNGGFETGSLPPWTTTTTTQVEVLKSSANNPRAPKSGSGSPLGGKCTYKPQKGSYFAQLTGTAKSPAQLSQTVSGLDESYTYSISFFLANAEKTNCTITYGFPPADVLTTTIPTALATGPCTYPPMPYSFPVLAPIGMTTATFSVSFSCNTGNYNIAIDSATLVQGQAIVGDPVFTGFQGQFFRVKGVPQRVFNIISTPTLQFNTRFVPLNAGDSMDSASMKQARMMREIQQGAVSPQSVNYIPRTTAWNHNGTYMGECGVKILGSRVRVVPGPYLTGFASVTLDGAEMELSHDGVEVAEGYALKRTSHRVDIMTPLLRFAIVNSDKFINVESAAVLEAYSPELHLDGLLGQTADAEWTVQKTAHWRKHLEEDHMLASDDVFGDDFSRNQYSEKH